MRDTDTIESTAQRSAEMAAFLQILRTADLLDRELAALLKPHGLSPTQYNVLRILRGAGPNGLACGRVAERMLTRDPDITRLLDRMESRGFIERARDLNDRRVVVARLTPDGKKILAPLDRPVLSLHQAQLGRLGRGRLRALAGLLREARERTSA